MDSNNKVVMEKGFTEWIKLDDENTNLFPVPDLETGTYLLRLVGHEPPERKVGSSDIVKIGEGVIYNRFERYLGMVEGVQATAKKIIKAREEWGWELEASWVLLSKEKARELQDELLAIFEKDHKDIPALHNIKS